MKSETVLGMLCLCKQTHQSPWTRRTNFARIRRVPQEAKSERAILRFTTATGNVTDVAGVVELLVLVAGPCLKACVRQQRWS